MFWKWIRVANSLHFLFNRRKLYKELASAASVSFGVVDDSHARGGLA